MSIKSEIKELSSFKFWFELVFIIIPIAFLIRTFIFGLYKVPSGSMETTLLISESFVSDKLSYWFIKPKRGEIIAFNNPEQVYSDNKLMNLWQRFVWSENWTKRVIGVPGDHVKGVIEDGRPVIYVNGQKLINEPYVNKYPLIEIAVPKGKGILVREHRSFDPAISWDKQKFYVINPAMILVNACGDQIERLPGTPVHFYSEQRPAWSTGDSPDEFDIILGNNQYWAMGDNRLGSTDSRFFGPLDGSRIHGRIFFRIFSLDSDENWMVFDLLKHPIDFFKRIRYSRCLQIVR